MSKEGFIPLNFNIKYLKKLWIKSNIDLLIWLKWQTFESVKKDINYINKLWVDNVSVHYFMNSNNLNYKLDNNYLEIVWKVKEYLSENKNSPSTEGFNHLNPYSGNNSPTEENSPLKLPNSSPNIWESYFASKEILQFHSEPLLWQIYILKLFTKNHE